MPADLVDSKLIGRIDGLISKADKLLGTVHGSEFGKWVDGGGYAALRTQALACLIDILGPKHTYSQEFQASVDSETGSNTPTEVEKAKGILLSLKEDIEKGHLQTFRELVNADLFGDFIEMAEHLHEAGYKDPAAVIAGSVLEEHLRQLCNKNGVAVTSPDKNNDLKPKKADTLNADLCKANVITSIQQKQVTAWLGLRNSAAHGKYDEYTADQVKLMIQGITNFIAQLPA